MVQLLPSASLTKLLPSSLMVPLTLVDFGAVEGLCFVGSLLDCAGSCARAISGSARKMESVAIQSFFMRVLLQVQVCVQTATGRLTGYLSCLALVVLAAGFRDRRIPRSNLPLGFFLRDPIALHNLAGQPVAFAGNHVEVVIGKLSPLLADRPFQLHPLTFHLFPVHLYGLLYMMKALWRERTLPSQTSRHSKHEQDHNDQSQPAARVITPIPAVRPRGQSAEQQQNQNHKQDRRHGFSSRAVARIVPVVFSQPTPPGRRNISGRFCNGQGNILRDVRGRELDGAERRRDVLGPGLNPPV